eukprot:CAMPEP_0181168352 /NCGR_PEP_ID=MMETSP1096-20121128/225_1 /TAXON_ID=156174 ORGANISM="Chrysochromulina ericina, Strain CCMP281" /NCGR_SAMPLE_ID=MMETSP1096 /ASSEMBLY_ACC=CAM_ASM_000453 /LENGTH=227 /DNA_ID=CAMNT_0023255717 /DNA_START=579 /DNA_END=1263 /DNA_ORIENTATION=+
MGQTASGDVQNGGKRPMGSAVGTTRGTGTMHGVLGGSSSQSKPSAAQSGGDNDIAGNRKRSKPPDDDAVELVGERTLQQRNAEGFAAAIHLDDDAGTPQWADHGVRSGGSGAAGSATATPADPEAPPRRLRGGGRDEGGAAAGQAGRGAGVVWGAGRHHSPHATGDDGVGGQAGGGPPLPPSADGFLQEKVGRLVALSDESAGSSVAAGSNAGKRTAGEAVLLVLPL